MKSFKSIVFIMTVLLSAGCADGSAQTASPKEAVAPTTASEAANVTETTESAESEPQMSKWLADYLKIHSLTFTDDDKALVEMIYKNSEINFREENKPSD